MPWTIKLEQRTATDPASGVVVHFQRDPAGWRGTALNPERWTLDENDPHSEQTVSRWMRDAGEVFHAEWSRSPLGLLDAAVRLLRDSGKHFKSRQVAEARQLIEQAIKQLEEKKL